MIWEHGGVMEHSVKFLFQCNNWSELGVEKPDFKQRYVSEADDDEGDLTSSDLVTAE